MLVAGPELLRVLNPLAVVSDARSVCLRSSNCQRQQVAVRRFERSAVEVQNILSHCFMEITIRSVA